MEYPGFIGPSATPRSRNVNTDQTKNLYLERQDSGTPKVTWNLYGTPGVTPILDSSGDPVFFDGLPVLGLFYQDGRAFGVGGPQAGELVFDSTTGAWSLDNTTAVADDGLSASFSSNGTGGDQVFLTTGGEGYVFTLSSDTWAQVTDPQFPTDVGANAYMDGYSLVHQRNTRAFYISALEDSSSWDGLDVFERSIGSDDIVTMLQNHRYLYLLGSKTSEVWQDVGDATTPFQPVTGILIQQGSVAEYGGIRVDNSIAWIGLNEAGQGAVYRMDGYEPIRISTFAVEYWLNTSTDLSASVAFSYAQDGHVFVGWYVPDLTTTWVFDVSVQQWAERLWWQAGQDTPWVGRCCVAAFGKVLVGDRQSGGVYDLRLDQYHDEILVAS